MKLYSWKDVEVRIGDLVLRSVDAVDCKDFRGEDIGCEDVAYETVLLGSFEP